MTVTGRYLVGLALVGVVGAAVASTVSPAIQPEVTWSLLLALMLQAPLGWWTIRSIGHGRFQLIWTLGMLIRLGVLALVAMVLVPLLGWQAGPALGTLVAVMVALLLVEAVTAVGDHSWKKE